MDFETSKAEWGQSRYSNGDSKHVHVVLLMPKSWLSVHQDQTEIWRKSYREEKGKVASLLCQARERSRLALQELCSPPWPTGEAIQSGKECDRDQSSNSLPSFHGAKKRARLLTKLGSVLGKIEGKRRGWQSMRWSDSIPDSLGMNLGKLGRQ